LIEFLTVCIFYLLIQQPITQVQTSVSNIQPVPSTTPSTEEEPSVATQQQLSSPQQPSASVSGEEKPVGVEPPTMEQQLLAGQPPGTVIKCVTAQVIQTTQGPRIVLQGLQGAEFTQQQLTVVQQQVKQQLLKGKVSSLASTRNRVHKTDTTRCVACR
jgi:nucleosome-remodeling factor subunit BPTF